MNRTSFICCVGFCISIILLGTLASYQSIKDTSNLSNNLITYNNNEYNKSATPLGNNSGTLVRNFSLKVITITDNGYLHSNHHHPQSYYYKGMREGIYVVYSRLDRIENNPDNDIDSFIRYYDFKADTVSEEYLIGLGHGDSHGAPVLCVDNRGYIHVFFGCHSDKMEYYVSEYPEDVTSWVNKTSLLPDGKYTYPTVLYCDGSIYVFFRSLGHGGKSRDQGKYAYIKSDDYGKTWSNQINFVDPSNNEYAISVYPSDAKYRNGYLHVVWWIMLESGPYSNYYGLGSNETQYNAYYARSPDGVTWYNIDNSYSSTCITMSEMDKYYQVLNTTNCPKIVGQFLPEKNFIRYKTSTPPRLDISSSGSPYIGLTPAGSDAIIRYWKDGWRTISVPNNFSRIPYFISKEISELPVNALGIHSKTIYLTNIQGYNGSDEEIFAIGGVNSYKYNSETQTFDVRYHYHCEQSIGLVDGIGGMK